MLALLDRIAHPLGNADKGWFCLHLRRPTFVSIMRIMRTLFKKMLGSVTIMVIPHDNLKVLNLKVPVVGLLVPAFLATIGAGYLLCLAANGFEYKAQHHTMAEKVKFYSEQFYQWDSTVMALKSDEGEFRRLFALETKEEVLKNMDTSFVGSLEIPDLIVELKKTIETVEEIKNYLRIQKDIYVATPRGYPVSGSVTSPYGKRTDPFSGNTVFHSGIDISCSPGSPIRATADGVVSFSGWTPTSGYVVVLEHGCGFSTVYAHNKANRVKVGHKVKREDIIGYVGSTGKSTGPHLHYEVWKDGKNVDVEQYLPRRT
jgi:murein DD-endopeptidase MepM/ murein hydrolase activator NlpD